MFYVSFIEEMIKEFEKFEGSFESFLDKNMKRICKKHALSCDTLLWAVNMNELSHRLNQDLGIYKDRVILRILENLKGTY